jgi:hypothetical protein
MKIHRISLRDFRGVVEADVEFATDGVTIVQGPNEVGKSSLADALDMLIADPDSSSKSRVKAAQPVGRDVGPWVEVDIECGPYRLTYSKRWVRGAGTELLIESPAREQLQGRAAHDRVTAIIAETMDAELFAALRHQQGVPLGQAELAGSDSLMHALDAAAGSGSESAEPGGALIDAIDRERQIWSTPTGEPNKARKDLREAAETTQIALDGAEESLRALEARVDEFRRLDGELARNAEQEPDLRSTVTRLETEVQAVSARESALHDLRMAAEKAMAPARDATAAADARTAAIAAVAAAEAEVGVITAEGVRAAARLDAALAVRTEASARLVAALDARADAERAFDVAAADAQHLRDLFDLGSLRTRRGLIGDAEKTIADGEAFLAGCALDAELLARIETAVVDEAGARGRRDAAGAALQITAESAQQLEVGGVPRSIAAGETLALPVGAGDELVITGVARIGIEGRGDVVTAALQARAHLDALLVQAGVSPADGETAARDLDRRRLDAEATVKAARESRGWALNDLTLEEMDDKIARAEGRVAAYASGRGAAPPIPADADAANTVRAATEDARDSARRDEDAARDAHTQADSAVTGLEAQASERKGHLGAVARRLGDAETDLQTARAAQSDAQVNAAAAETDAAAVAARAALHAEEAALGDADPESLRLRLANSRDAVDRLLRERNDIQLLAARMKGEISQQGDEGLADRVAHAREAAGNAEAERDLAERRAAAVDLLYATMARHRDIAQRAYVAPFREAVERFGRLVFGAGTEVEVDHTTLQVVSRTREGVTVPVEALSGGAREQMALIGRLAAASLVAPAADGGAPVIIDDALGYSDAGRLEGLGAALAEAGKTCQVIVLTCMPERYSGIGSARVVRLDRTGPVEA